MECTYAVFLLRFFIIIVAYPLIILCINAFILLKGDINIINNDISRG